MNVETLLIAGPVLLFSIVLHEWAHGLAAYHQGDTSVRVTLDPRPYIDPIGSIAVPALSLLLGWPPFGWARSWPFDKRKFRNFKRGDIIVSLAGVTANFALAVVCTLLVVIVGVIAGAIPAARPSLAIFQAMLSAGIQVNLILAVLNLLPLPPFDGSHVVKYLLPPAWALSYMRVGAYGFLIFFAVINFAPWILQAWLTPAYLLAGLASSATGPFMLPNPLTS